MISIALNTPLIQIFLKITTRQHRLFCPFPSRQILLQCSLAIVANPVLEKAQYTWPDHELFFKGSILIWILTRLANLLQQPIKAWFSQFVGNPRGNSAFLALRLLHPTFRPRTRSQIFEWLKAIFVGLNLVPKVAKWCKTMSAECIKKLLKTCIALNLMACY